MTDQNSIVPELPAAVAAATDIQPPMTLVEVHQNMSAVQEHHLP